MNQPAPKLDAGVLREIGQSLPIALLRAREAAMNRFRPMLREHGLTEQQWRVIRVLVGSGPLAVGELAKRSFLLAPSLSRILQALESSEIVQRQSVEDDGRRFVVSITPRGMALYENISPLSEAIYRDIEARFGRGRLSQLLDLLEQLDAALI